jgi:hypothetical protein
MYRRERGYGNRLLSEKYAKANFERHKKKVEDVRTSGNFGDIMIRRSSPDQVKYTQKSPTGSMLTSYGG